MKFYGVGVMLGGFGTDPEDIMQICKDHNFWYMGWDKEYFPDKHDSIEMMEEIIKSVHIGDIVFAKAFHFASPRKLYIRAIGRVTSLEMPMDIPNELKQKYGFPIITQ